MRDVIAAVTDHTRQRKLLELDELVRAKHHCVLIPESGDYMKKSRTINLMFFIFFSLCSEVLVLIQKYILISFNIIKMKCAFIIRVWVIW